MSLARRARYLDAEIPSCLKEKGVRMSYRVYKLNARDQIVDAEWLEADSDEEAMVAAHRLFEQRRAALELWQGTRKIARIP